MLDTGGNKFWFKNGNHHRDRDLPAVVYKDGTLFWYVNSKLISTNSYLFEKYELIINKV